MFMHARLAVLAAVSGLIAAAFTVDLAGVRAESPLQFLTKQHRQQQSSYEREPVRVERGGLFGGFFDMFESPPPVRGASSANLQRVICKRQCDGAQLVLGIVASRSKHKDAEAMCAAAGGGAETALVVEKFVPGAGFAMPALVQTASAAPLMEGRAALDARAHPRPAAAPCPPTASAQPFMTVPILNDATLRNGDVVATKAGFKVFVGSGKPPFKNSDFVDVDTKKRVAAEVRKLKVADR